MGIIGASMFLGLFYLNLYWSYEEESIPKLSSNPPVSIIMPAYNESGKVKESLRSALEIDYPVDIIFVDDGSTDDTLQKARKFSENRNLTIIEHGENQGKAGALNTALERVETDYVVVQDADSAIGSDLIEKSLAKLEANSDLAAVIGSIQNFESDTMMRKLQRVQYQMTNFYRSLMASIGTLDVTPGAFSMYRTEDVKGVGGFDEGNPTEDLEMAWRLRKSGKDLDMVFSSESRTEFPESFKGLFHQRVRWKRGSIVNLIKHREMFFNKDYSWFGRLQLPLHAASPLLAATSLLLVFVGLSEVVYNAIVYYSATGFTFPALNSINWMRLLLSVQYKIYVPLGLGMIVSAIMIKTAYKEGGKNFRNPKAVFIYFMWFFAFQGFFTLSAIIKEMLQTKRIWT